MPQTTIHLLTIIPLRCAALLDYQWHVPSVSLLLPWHKLSHQNTNTMQVHKKADCRRKISLRRQKAVLCANAPIYENKAPNVSFLNGLCPSLGHQCPGMNAKCISVFVSLSHMFTQNIWRMFSVIKHLRFVMRFSDCLWVEFMSFRVLHGECPKTSPSIFSWSACQVVSKVKGRWTFTFWTWLLP